MKTSILIAFGALVVSAGVLWLRAAPIPNQPPSIISGPNDLGAKGTQDVGPTIVWTIPGLSETLYPGTSTTTTVGFSSNSNLTGVAVSITPSLKGIVSVSPSAFASVSANQMYSLTVTVTAPSNFIQRSFGGTLHLESSGGQSKTYASPLSVNLATTFATYSNPVLGVSFDYPPALFLVDSKSPSSAALLQTSPQEINLGGALPEDPQVQTSSSGYVIGVQWFSSPVPVTDLPSWVHSTFPTSEIDIALTTSIAGFPAIQVTFQDEVGAGEPRTFVAVGTRVLRVSYSATFDVGSPDYESGLQIYNSLLHSISFQ